MRRPWIALLRCPACRGAYDLDPIREDGAEVLEAFLVCRECREERLVLGGVAVLPADLTAHLRAHGNVYRRTPIADPRMVRFVLGQVWEGGDVVPFDEVVRRYGDLASAECAPAECAPAEGAPTALAEEDAALVRLLATPPARKGRGLDIGTGVGRGTFVLTERLGEAIGVDRSVARVRRARNVATTSEPFTVPARWSERGGAPRVKEIPLALERLSRQGAAFAAVDAERLPFADRAFDVVVLRDGDGVGPWPDPAAAVREARRVIASGGLLIVARSLASEVRAGAPDVEERPFVAWSAP